jgi:AcrR family transcriptional regulator
MHARLVSSSPELISTKSINEIKVEDIAALAEVSKTTFYKCFRSVEDLLNTSAKQVAQELFESIVSAGDPINDSAVRLATKTKLVIRVATSVPLLGKLMLKAKQDYENEMEESKIKFN